MALDRDLAVAIARALAVGRPPRATRGWEMLAATGVRGLRVLVESDWLGELLLTEANPAAFAVLAANAARYADRGARVERRDALHPPEGVPFDAVDLDPYGSPLPFLDAALDALGPPAVLAVTATDLRVLAGADSAACRRRYGAQPVRGRLGPEGGLRILLGRLALVASARGLRVDPLIAYPWDHYVRATVRLVDDAEAARAPRVGLVGGPGYDGPPLGTAAPAGPMWTGRLLDPELAARLDAPPSPQRPEELARLLAHLREEAGVPALFFYEGNTIARRLHLASPPSTAALRDGLGQLGFATAPVAGRPGALRTNAPLAEVDRVARSAAAR
jgi:tRNA (guanine26-N2/guanine27-N2)-dimethyltransferase